MTVIHIPTPLRPYTNGDSRVEVSGDTVAEALTALTETHSGLARHLRDDAGKAFREAVEREKELLQEYEKLTDQSFDDE